MREVWPKTFALYVAYIYKKNTHLTNAMERRQNCFEVLESKHFELIAKEDLFFFIQPLLTNEVQTVHSSLLVIAKMSIFTACCTAV